MSVGFDSVSVGGGFWFVGFFGFCFVGVIGLVLVFGGVFFIGKSNSGLTSPA